MEISSLLEDNNPSQRNAALKTVTKWEKTGLLEGLKTETEKNPTDRNSLKVSLICMYVTSCCVFNFKSWLPSLLSIPSNFCDSPCHPYSELWGFESNKNMQS